MNQFNGYIQNGYFGVNQPMTPQNQYQYNPYTQPIQQQQFQQYMNPPTPIGNLIGVGNYNYNTTGFNPYNQTNNGYVFQPATQTPYGINPYEIQKQQQQSNYYSPYANTYGYQAQMQQPIMNPYSYNSYGGYMPFISLQQQQAFMASQIELQKMKHRCANKFLGKDSDEEFLDRLYNPNNKANQLPKEKIQENQEWNILQRYIYCINNPNSYLIDNPYQRQANFIILQSKNYHEAFDNHSLCEFLEEDLPRLNREFWIAAHINKNSTRNLNAMYNSKDYNELLKMHRSSNPYLNEILDNSRYDNNLDDMEIGLAEMFEREKQRRNLLSQSTFGQPLPSFISSEETRKKRELFTRELMNQIYEKGAIKGTNV